MKSIISLSVFTALAFVAWWTITADYSMDNQTQPSNADHYVIAYMNDFELTAMDKTGAPSYTLEGAHMEKLNLADETIIQQPVFHLLQSKSQWKISADSAIVNDKNETILLTDNVIMQQQNSTAAKNTSPENTTSDTAVSENKKSVNDKSVSNTSVSNKSANIKPKKFDSKNSQPTITIRTPSLLIHTRKQIAETHAMVKITQGNSQLNANGMIFNNITNELELTPNVHGSITAND